MKIEDQVCSLEQAKKLQEFGISCTSLLSYWEDCKMEWIGKILHKTNKIDLTERMRPAADDLGLAKEIYPAFTVAELGVMLPENISTNSNIRFADLIKRVDSNQWMVGYDYDSPTGGGYEADVKAIYLETYGDTEAEACAEMLLCLLIRKIITVESVNSKL